MKTHWLSLTILALLVLWLVPDPASAARRDRIQRRAQRNAPQPTARVATPPYQPRFGVDRLFFATPQARRYYRRNGWPATNANRPPVARTPQAVPRNLVERPGAVEQLPELREPSLSTRAQPRVDRAVESANYVEAGDFGAEPLRDARDANQQWRQERIEEIERRLQALEAVQSANEPRPEPLAD